MINPKYVWWFWSIAEVICAVWLLYPAVTGAVPSVKPHFGDHDTYRILFGMPWFTLSFVAMLIYQAQYEERHPQPVVRDNSADYEAPVAYLLQ